MSAHKAVAPPRLCLTALSKRYGAMQANAGIDLAVAAGEIHALLGENGAGKSTLVKMICGLVKPDSGGIAWEGTPPPAGGRPRSDTPTSAKPAIISAQAAGSGTGAPNTSSSR